MTSRMLWLTGLVAFALTQAACGSGASGSGNSAVNSNGTGGSSNTTGSSGTNGTASSSAVAFSFTQDACPSVTSEVPGVTLKVAATAVYLSDRALGDACHAVASGCTQLKNNRTVQIEIVNYSTSGAAPSVGPGTYAVASGLKLGTGSFASALVANTDDKCVYTATSAGGGTVVVDSVASGLVTGHYELTFQGAPTVSGSFSAPICQVDFAAHDLCSASSWPTCSGGIACQ